MRARFFNVHSNGSSPFYLAGTAAFLLLAATPPAQAEGLTFDMRMQSGEDGGKAEEQTVMVAHRQYMDGNSRVEFTKSMGAGGMMGPGTYVITKAGSSKQYIVNPAKHEFSELDPEELAKTASQLGGGGAKMETSDIQIDTQSLGPGETVQGYSTVKYRITQAYNTTMTIMGKTNRSTERSTSDVWIAPKLAGVFDPTVDQMKKAAAGNKELGERMAVAYAKLPKGLPLKSVMRSESNQANDKTVNVIKMEILNIKPGPINLAAFEIPAGYKRTDMFESMKGVGAGSPNSQNAAPSNKPAATQPAASQPAANKDNAVSDVADAAKDGAKEGATEEAKNQAKEETKKAMRGVFGK